MEWGGVNGAIGENESASGDIGSSRMLGDTEVPLLRGDTEDALPMASKAFILDCNKVEGAMGVELDEYGTILAMAATCTATAATCDNMTGFDSATIIQAPSFKILLFKRPWHLLPLLDLISMP